MSASHIQQLGDGAAPSPGDELMLFQILLGSWPLELRADDKAAMEQYCTRILQWQEKALRKARSEEHTSELQSLMRISYAVFCLKKKTIKLKNNIHNSLVNIIRLYI